MFTIDSELTGVLFTSTTASKSTLLADYTHGFCGRGRHPSDVHYPKQVHGIALATASAGTAPDCDDHHRVAADAVFTTQPNVKIAVRTADCVPLLAVADNFALAVHAGWRGLFAGILANCADKLATDHSLDVRAAKWVIGPAISAPHYEVGDELIDRLFTAELGLTREQALICILRGKRRWHLDLQIACIYGLRNLGIAASSIEVIRICTYEQHEEFYSYRFAAATRTGSNWSYVCL